MRLAGTILLAVLAATCSSPTKPGPIAVELAIQSVSPTSGPASGGTEVTIRGAGFATGVTITIGGRPATDVAVRGADIVAAKTPVSATAGPVDVAVMLNGRAGTLAGGFRYEGSTSTAPIIKSITAQGTRPNQPPLFADYGETIRVAAVVEDPDTSAAQLKYQWTACGGAFTGSGAQVEWRVPASGTVPPMCSIEVVVMDGANQAVSSVVVRLHDSMREVSILALEFLEDFANNAVPAASTVRNFSNACSGKSDELADVTFVRNTRRIDSYIYGTAAATVAFGSMCRTKAADACVITPVEWRSTVIDTSALEVAKGTSIISGVYRDSRWWLCDSLFQGASSLRLRFVR